ncbi:Sua5/YciO/YrdC/YwlC family protein [Streptomyces sp. SID3212]|uniref:Sua5/YciO/YrdC/YwlC family protein n=1 Tax=Streptomyces sp. SID3212 TaxID=2690259 RepID=UPI001370EED6|nr:translation factor Sua5 [Streptomyces sp. SID3212]
MRSISLDQLNEAARAVEEGGLVIVPTRRWYMICADATNEAACRSIFDAKQRPLTKSLVLVSPSAEHCERHFVVHHEARKLMEAFWPGDLALLLPWRDEQTSARYTAVGAPALVTRSSDALGRLAAAAAVPVAATTVNVSGDAHVDAPGPSITIDEVQDFLKLTDVPVSVVLDGGVCPVANHLAIVDCVTPEARLVRVGLVHQRALSAALGRELVG